MLSYRTFSWTLLAVQFQIVGLSNVIFGGDNRQLKTRPRSEDKTLPANNLIFSLNGKIWYLEKRFQFMHLLNENSIASSILLLLQIFF